MEEQKQEIYGSFDRVETAQRLTNGNVYAMRGHDIESVIIVEDQLGRHFVYISPDYEQRKVRGISEKIYGQKISQDGYDADHVASKMVEKQLGQKYVLLGFVDSGANRSAGTSRSESGKSLNRGFNNAAGGGGTPVSREQWNKLADLKRDEYVSLRDAPPTLVDVAVQKSLALLPGCQARMKAMRGTRIVGPEHTQPAVQPQRLNKPLLPKKIRQPMMMKFRSR